MNRAVTALLLSLTAGMVAGCGAQSGPNVAEGGIGGSGISMGRVAQVGSVCVNGIHYNTDSAVFVISGSEINGGLADISVGMVVRVTGSKDTATGTGVAERVVYNSLLIGPVDTLFDSTRSQIGVMGQAVHVNADTVMEDIINNPALTVGQLPVGTLVEVSGYPSAPGEILATRIELKPATDLYEVTGTVSATDALNNRFTIGGLTIDASAAAPPLPSEGSYVHVEGPLPPSGGSFSAESIIPIETGVLAADGEELSLEGVITVTLDPATHLFSVNGQSIDASLTPYSQDPSKLAAGNVVEVDGVMNGGVLLAESIEIEVDDNNTTTPRGEIASILESGDVDLASKTVTLLGKTVRITNSTIFESDRHGESTFSLDELRAGDFLTAKAVDNGGELTATKLELDDAHSYNAAMEGTPKIHGGSGGSLIEILGVVIDTTGVSGYTFEEVRVEVRGNYDPNTQTLVATRIERHD